MTASDELDSGEETRLVVFMLRGFESEGFDSADCEAEESADCEGLDDKGLGDETAVDGRVD